jgi:hypothetical protein
MTFDEIVAEVQTPFNLTSVASATRIGKWVNTAYKNLCSDFGIQTTSTVEGVAVNTTVGNRQMVFSASTTTPAIGVERILSLYDASVTPNRLLFEISRDEMRNRPLSSDPASFWAVLLVGAASVTINLNCVPATIYTLTADVLSTKATLSGSDVPAFAEDFHDILTFYAQWREALKQQQWEAANRYEEMYHGPRDMDGQHRGGRLAEYRYYLALSAHRKVYQGKTPGPGSITTARI